MSILDYEMKNARDFLLFSAFINFVFFILFIIVDFKPLANRYYTDDNTSRALLFSSMYGLWFYLETGIFMMGTLYMAFFLWKGLSDTQRMGVLLFVGSILFLDIKIIFGSWERTIFPIWLYIGLFMFWIGLNLIYGEGGWVWLFSFGTVASFVVQFFLLHVDTFMFNYYIPGNYSDRLVYLNIVKTGIGVLWFWGIVFRWYFAKTFQGIPIILERKKAYALNNTKNYFL